jgi:hypothetical protein
VSGQGGPSREDLQNFKPIVYRIDADARVSKLTEAPKALEFQNNTGPLPQSPFVRFSKGHSAISVRTENTTELRTLFKADGETGELVPLIGSNKALHGDR